MSDDSKLANTNTVLGWMDPGAAQKPAAPAQPASPKSPQQPAPALFPQQTPPPQLHGPASQAKTMMAHEAFQMPPAAQGPYAQYPQAQAQAQYPQAGQYAQPQYPQAEQYGQPQYPQAAQYAQPQYPQAAQYAQPQYPQAAQYAQPQYPQAAQYAQPQYPQAAQYAQSQYPQAQAQYPQAQPQYPQAAQYAQQLPHQGQYAHAPYAAPEPAYGQSASKLPHARAIDGATATVGVSDRMRFIRLTYLHLLGAILVFAGLEYLIFTNETLGRIVGAPLVNFALGGRFNWLIVLGVFMAVSWIADYFASHTSSRPLQYVGLGVYILAETLIFVPLLFLVAVKTQAIIAKGGANPNILRDAALVTLAIFGALTASVFLTKKDFSFLRTGLAIASAGAMMLIILSLAFGFNLGIVFSIAMVLLSAGYILYQTSQIFAHYHTEAYVGAALALFSSIALMFWYVIRILMRLRN